MILLCHDVSCFVAYIHGVSLALTGMTLSYDFNISSSCLYHLHDFDTFFSCMHVSSSSLAAAAASSCRNAFLMYIYLLYVNYVMLCHIMISTIYLLVFHLLGCSSVVR
jgi:hypothetical protein